MAVHRLLHKSSLPPFLDVVRKESEQHVLYRIRGELGRLGELPSSEAKVALCEDPDHLTLRPLTVVIVCGRRINLKLGRARAGWTTEGNRGGSQCIRFIETPYQERKAFWGCPSRQKTW